MKGVRPAWAGYQRRCNAICINSGGIAGAAEGWSMSQISHPRKTSCKIWVDGEQLLRSLKFMNVYEVLK
jgi:hypothetical protein